MRRPEEVPAFSKALLSGALTGLVATVVNIVYNLIFRSITRYMPDEEFNILSIMLASMLVFIILGGIFFICIRYLSVIAFTIALVVIVVAGICITAFAHSDDHEQAFYGNHGLIGGFTLISGLLGLILLPYFYKHPKIYI